jgi:anaerobic ribonucleoside-triphosphate reductase activating protein
MKEHTWLLDPATGMLVADGMTAADATAVAGDLLPPPRAIGCARPLTSMTLPSASHDPTEHGSHLRVATVYHGSLIDGPGRRSVCQVQGCSIRCPGCHVPWTHDASAGVLFSISQLLALLLDPAGAPRDGITITGGEPFDQAEALRGLLQELKLRGLHALVYTGYTLEALAKRADGAVRQALDLTDILLDGPYVAALASGSGSWRGSRNQRLVMPPLTHLGTGVNVPWPDSEHPS